MKKTKTAIKRVTRTRRRPTLYRRTPKPLTLADVAGGMSCGVRQRHDLSLYHVFTFSDGRPTAEVPVVEARDPVAMRAAIRFVREGA